MLTSIAEVRAEARGPSESHRDETLHLLHEALELFQRCLNVQEFKFTQAQEIAAQNADAVSEANEGDTGTMSEIASNALEEGLWASVEEPISKDTLLDTAVAQLDTLTAICSLGTIAHNNDLAWVEEYYRNTLQEKIVSFIDKSGRQHGAALAKAKFVSAISDAAFRSERLDVPTYERELDTAFNHQDLDLNNDPQGLCDRADAYLAFSASIQSPLQQAYPTETSPIATICWKHITKALDGLTTASKLPGAQNLPRIHLRRGDCELLRLRLGELPLAYDHAIKSAPTLLKNAKVYFRGAATFAKSENAVEERFEAEVKEAVAAMLGGDRAMLSSLVKLRQQSVEVSLGDMRDEGLLGEEGMQRIASL